MALNVSSKSLLTYGIQITNLNNAIDWMQAGGGTVFSAFVPPGFYSVSELVVLITSILNSADASQAYLCSVNRAVAGGTQNRITISASVFLSLLFASGPNAANTIAPVLGFALTDRTGSLTYTGITNSGTLLLSTLAGYNFIPPTMFKKVFGAKNVSASGVKDAITFPIQRFTQVQFKYETTARVESDWQPFLDWAMQQYPYDFTPQISDPTTVYSVTLETVQGGADGMAYQLKEMLPQFPDHWDLGIMMMRLEVD